MPKELASAPSSVARHWSARCLTYSCSALVHSSFFDDKVVKRVAVSFTIASAVKRSMFPYLGGVPSGLARIACTRYSPLIYRLE